LLCCARGIPALREARVHRRDTHEQGERCVVRERAHHAIGLEARQQLAAATGREHGAQRVQDAVQVMQR
jgi:hypothetical protein